MNVLKLTINPTTTTIDRCLLCCKISVTAIDEYMLAMKLGSQENKQKVLLDEGFLSLKKPPESSGECSEVNNKSNYNYYRQMSTL